MTVPAAVTTYRYEGNGVTTVFAYSNRLLTTADVKVQILTRATDAIVETLALTTDYTVTLVSNSLANITITNATKIPSVTQDILLTLDLAISQTRSYPRADSLPAADIEKGLDKLTLIAQKQDDKQTLTLRFPDSDTNTDGELPPKAERALTYLAFDADGVPIASASAAGGAPAGAFGATLVATATQLEAQTLLAVPPFTPASASGPATLAFAEDTDNGTNKVTLAAPSSVAADVTVTLPGTADTLVGRATTDTLTNKTLTAPVLSAGTTGLASFTATAGTNLTTATAGSTEYDGKVEYFTPQGTQRGVVPAEQVFTLNSALVGGNVTTAQDVFGVGVTLSGSTRYQFEATYNFSKSAGATSHTVGLLFGGTATLNDISYNQISGASTTSFTAGFGSVFTSAPQVATTTVITTAIASATSFVVMRITGVVSVNVGGTFRPQYILSAAPGGAYSTAAGSTFRIYPIGASGANVNVGAWA